MADSPSAALRTLRLVCAAPGLVIGLALFFSVLGWVYVWYLPNVYQSETRAYVDVSAANYAILNSFSLFDHKSSRDLAHKALADLVGTVNLEKVAIENNLWLDVLTARDKRSVLEGLKEGISVIVHSRS